MLVSVAVDMIFFFGRFGFDLASIRTDSVGVRIPAFSHRAFCFCQYPSRVCPAAASDPGLMVRSRAKVDDLRCDVQTSPFYLLTTRCTLLTPDARRDSKSTHSAKRDYRSTESHVFSLVNSLEQIHSCISTRDSEGSIRESRRSRSASCGLLTTSLLTRRVAFRVSVHVCDATLMIYRF